jgi:methionyl-tRNA formyltransferase
MNIIFIGSSNFGIPALRAVAAAGYRISCVVTQQDKPQNRGMHVEPTPVKIAAQELGLPVFQPADINAFDSIAYLKSLEPDIFLVIAYGQKLSNGILCIPRVMPVNIHGSLLPSYRGAAPINWAVINGECKTGNTFMKVTYKMDSGPVILQIPINIKEEDTSETIHDKLSLEAASLVINGLGLIENNSFQLKKQDESKATTAPKLKKIDGRIDWSKNAKTIHNLIRGTLPWPGAFTTYKGKILKIFKSSFRKSPLSNKPSEIVAINQGGIEVAAGSGILSIVELQMEGKKRMPAAEFVSGHSVTCGEKFV